MWFVVVTALAPPLRDVAVVVSLNARGVSTSTIETAKSLIPPDDVFVTADLEEAATAARSIVARGYSTVVSCGGDGTLAAAISHMCAASSLEALPRFVALPLGTGNAVARYVLGPRYRRWAGARGVRRALERLQHPVDEITVPVMRVDATDDLCFLGGCGFDSYILDDYKRLKDRVKKVPVLRRILSSVFGYFVATATATLPRYATGERRLRVRVSSNASVVYVDPRRGDAALPVAPGVLYEGPATIVAAGATPYYGGAMRLFPFARTAHGVHLRIARMSPWRFVPNCVGIFQGTYRSPNDALDFVTTNFTVDLLDKPAPLQHSGDALGDRHSFSFSVAGHVRFVDLLGLPPSLPRH